MPSVNYIDLELAFLATADSYLFDSATYICRKSGKIFYVSDGYDSEEEVPDNIEDHHHFALIPDKQDMDLGQRLVRRFAAQSLPDKYDQIAAIFSRKGAYSRYKGLLSKCGKLDEWYKFEESATRNALSEWAKNEGFTVIDQIPVT